MQKNTLRVFWQVSKQYPWRFSIAMLASIASVTVGSFIGPFIIASFLEAIQGGTVTFEGSLPLILTYLATQLYAEVIGWRITLYCVWTFETAGQNDLARKIFAHLSNQSLGFHSNRFGGSLVSQTTKLIGAFERFWDTIIFTLLPSLTSIVVATIILSFIFWQYALVLLGFSILYVIFVSIGSRFLAELNKQEAQASSATTGRLADAITNIMAVKSDGNESREEKEYMKYAKTWRGKSLANMRGFLKVSTGYSLVVGLLNTSALIAAILAIEHNIASVGVVYLCITYTFTVARQLWEVNSIIRSYNRVMGDAHDMTEILNIHPTIEDAPNAKPFNTTKGAIVFDAMSFTHGDASKNEQLFKNFNLVIRPGERIGLVGHSGSGKTTLTKLLLRFMDIDSGSISIDGHALSDVRQADLRRSIAYVPQEPLLFHRTIAENIAYGRPSASQKEIEAAAKKAHAHEFIVKLSDGYKTMVGERGVKLSGGQRQRIAIARAILKDAPILILDEATSALDSESEKLIQASLGDLMKNRTSIVIAHRLSTIAKLDRIVVLENGKIIEDDTHTQLLKKKGTYATLWSHQSGGFIEE